MIEYSFNKMFQLPNLDKTTLKNPSLHASHQRHTVSLIPLLPLLFEIISYLTKVKIILHTFHTDIK